MGSRESTGVRLAATPIIVLNALPIALIVRKFLGRKLLGTEIPRDENGSAASRGSIHPVTLAPKGLITYWPECGAEFGFWKKI